ncbi:hypothetical protein ABPG75_013981 [Micractinium tetrahymenae]
MGLEGSVPFALACLDAARRDMDGPRMAPFGGQQSDPAVQHCKRPAVQPVLQPLPAEPAAAQQPSTPQALQQCHVTREADGQQPRQQQQEQRGKPKPQEDQEEERQHRRQRRQQVAPGASFQGQPDCNTPTAAQEQTSRLTALFDTIGVAGKGGGPAEGTRWAGLGSDCAGFCGLPSSLARISCSPG